MGKDSDDFCAGIEAVIKQETNRRSTGRLPKRPSLEDLDNRRDRFTSDTLAHYEGTFGKWDKDDG